MPFTQNNTQGDAQGNIKKINKNVNHDKSINKNNETSKKILALYWRQNRIIKDERLINVFLKVARELFLRNQYKEFAYEDTPLPSLRGKTISQPTTVMIMAQLLELDKNDEVLEIGAGSGYSAAIISRIAKKVHTTEIIPELVLFARENLKNAKIKNVEVLEVDGTRGIEGKVFDKIIITAAAKEFPLKLLESLKEGGIIVGPIGNKREQEMVRGIKEKGKIAYEFYGQFLFSPLHGVYGFED